MTRAMAVELAPLGIRVNAVRPGAIDSPALHETIAAGLLDPAAYWREFPISQPTQPADIAAVVILLLGAAGAHDHRCGVDHRRRIHRPLIKEHPP